MSKDAILIWLGFSTTPRLVEKLTDRVKHDALGRRRMDNVRVKGGLLDRTPGGIEGCQKSGCHRWVFCLAGYAKLTR